jgi:hypothetical protein
VALTAIVELEPIGTIEIEGPSPYFAVIGDPPLFWLAHLTRARVQSNLDALLAHEKVARTMDLIGFTAGALLVFGRYVPGGRFVVNASGLAGHPLPGLRALVPARRIRRQKSTPMTRGGSSSRFRTGGRSNSPGGDDGRDARRKGTDGELLD